MKKRLLISILPAILLVLLLPSAASADMGPKPSILIHFKGLEGQTYYVTLLSKGDMGHLLNESHNPEVQEKFSSYGEDSDGFSFDGSFADCSETHIFRMGYKPPGFPYPPANLRKN